jgi:hypothetical protein
MFSVHDPVSRRSIGANLFGFPANGSVIYVAGAL